MKNLLNHHFCDKSILVELFIDEMIVNSAQDLNLNGFFKNLDNFTMIDY